MKKIRILLVLVFVLFHVPVAIAAKGGKKGASDKAFEHANEKARFKRDPDWFNKIGNQKEDKTDKKTRKLEEKIDKETQKAKKKIEKIEEKSRSKVDRTKEKGQKHSEHPGKEIK